MKINLVKTAVILLGLWALLSGIVYAAPKYSGLELVNNAKALDGKEVEFTGEAVGEKMKRGAFFWLNLNDGKTAVGVWCPLEFSPAVGFYGSYNVKGDVVRVKGIFNRSCLEHGGDLDIHALNLSVLEKGYYVEHHLDKLRIEIGIILTILAFVSGVFVLLRKI